MKKAILVAVLLVLTACGGDDFVAYTDVTATPECQQAQATVQKAQHKINGWLWYCTVDALISNDYPYDQCKSNEQLQVDGMVIMKDILCTL